jgi:hypothetical protein
VDEGSLRRASGATVHPLFDPASGVHDLAVVLFTPGTFADVAPVSLPRPGALDALGPAGNGEGPQFTLVGYGAQIRTDGLDVAGYRATARASFEGLTPDWLLLSGDADDLPRSGALCQGDSGSPQFFGGSNIQVGLHHHHPGCAGTSLSQRLDTAAEQAFLAPFVALSLDRP